MNVDKDLLILAMVVFQSWLKFQSMIKNITNTSQSNKHKSCNNEFNSMYSRFVH